ncbi:succinate dehydrogenase, cytochrome b556 subunit [Methylopila sp. Yamaguchi]|uniref:succinate dehydrogenase, cytochrome b556 subunit n=1 Tax=Methylopila sp. Yamaguchi TaxID=1437817 RepID=UPI000CCBF867|nr:succinate dehydrogenase, cytochrome b556 subunit [Methylopila sp. Yamaguchi]
MDRRPAQRPLSPHLQIYRPTFSMVMSIVHRLTGATLYVGSLLVTVWLLAAASGPAAFAHVQAVYGSWPGRCLTFLYTWALIHHAMGGVRHLIWDTGAGFDHHEREYLARGSLACSVAATAAVWALVIWASQ